MHNTGDELLCNKKYKIVNFLKKTLYKTRYKTSTRYLDWVT